MSNDMTSSSGNKNWTAARVRQHLQNAVYLEMWTVPLYLAAAYSIQVPLNKDTQRPQFAQVPAKPDGSPDFDNFSQRDYNQYAFNNILSVAIQEMLHVELAANILNAVGPETPLKPGDTWVKFTDEWASNYYAAPACLAYAPLPEGVTLGLGPMNINQARLFQWIEHEDPVPPGDPEAYQETYTSIGDFYTSLSYGLKVCWGELYPPRGKKYKDPKNPTADELLQKDDWGSTMMFMNVPWFEIPAEFSHYLNQLKANDQDGMYKFSIRVYGPPADALTRTEAAIAAIKVQGEGAGSGKDVPTKYVPETGDPIEIALDRLTHWERFTTILKMALEGKVQIYSGRTPESLPLLRDLEKALNQSYSSFLASLDSAFNSTGTVGLDAMRGLGNRILQVWQNGGEPDYKWLNPDVAHDPKGQLGLHACQGLNVCAGQGVNNTGSLAGNGDCATGWYHTCGGSNMCKGQGGCGYAPTKEKNWQPDPNANSCEFKGGCGAPIPVGQVFSTDAPKNLQYKDVWDYARKLFIKEMKQKKKKVYTGALPPNDLRKTLSPTSSKPAPKPGDAASASKPKKRKQ
jgi:ferritin-like protein